MYVEGLELLPDLKMPYIVAVSSFLAYKENPAGALRRKTSAYYNTKLQGHPGQAATLLYRIFDLPDIISGTVLLIGHLRYVFCFSGKYAKIVMLNNSSCFLFSSFLK